MHEKIISVLKKLTAKEFIKLTDRGNSAINIALEFSKSIGKKRILIPDQGGWIHYQKAPKRFNLQLIEIKTDYGLIDLDELRKNADKNSVLLANSMPGYFVLDDMEKIKKICHEKNCILINDASGSIGTKEAKIGDIILGSFGKDKPVDLGYGGFIATNDKDTFLKFKESNFDESKLRELFEKLNNLNKKLENLQKIRNKILIDLKNFDIIYPEKQGINVIIRFNDEKTKNKIVRYCKNNNLEFTECPRYIRVNEKAISIEVKRI